MPASHSHNFADYLTRWLAGLWILVSFGHSFAIILGFLWSCWSIIAGFALALDTITPISFDMLAQFYAKLTYNISSLAISHYFWFITAVLAVYCTTKMEPHVARCELELKHRRKDLQHVMLEQSREEVEWMERRLQAKRARYEEFLTRERAEQRAVDVGAAYFEEEQLPT
jgi:hypothetical protein